MNHPSEIVTSTIVVKLRPDGIIETRPLEGFEGPSELKHAKEIMEAFVKVSGGKMRPTLNIMPNYYVTSEAQDFYANHPPVSIAAALVANSFIEKMVGNFFIRFKNMPIPTRMFETEEKAVKWLMAKWEEYRKVTAKFENPKTSS